MHRTTTTGNGAKYAPRINTISSNFGRGQYEVTVGGERAYGPASSNDCRVFVEGLRTAFGYFEHPADLCYCGAMRSSHEGRTAHAANSHDFELDADCTHGIASGRCDICGLTFAAVSNDPETCFRCGGARADHGDNGRCLNAAARA